MAKTFDYVGDQEPNALNRLQRRREAAKLRELARKEPPPTK